MRPPGRAPVAPPAPLRAQAPAPAPAPAPPIPVVRRSSAAVEPPAAWPPADPDTFGALPSDTVLDGARYGRSTLRAVAARGEAARQHGEPRSDTLLTARFGDGEDALLFAAVARGALAAEAARLIGVAVARSRSGLAEDLRSSDHGALKSGLQRLTDRAYNTLRTRLGDPRAELAVSLRCLLLPVDPGRRTRVAFGAGAGGLFRLREGGWRDLDPGVPEPGFLFRAVTARPGDVLLMCGGGLAEPLRAVPELTSRLAERWAPGNPVPALPAFLADVTTGVREHGDDRAAVAVWEDL